MCCITYYLIKIATATLLRRQKAHFKKKTLEKSSRNAPTLKQLPQENNSEYSHENFNIASIKVIIYIATFITAFLYDTIV
jgi:hypothetical protein